jgi:Cyclin M transmembrane N-terminal domain
MPTADGSWTGIIGILSVLLLVFANGFFVASEFSLVAVRRSRVAQLVAAGRAKRKGFASGGQESGCQSRRLPAGHYDLLLGTGCC